MTTYETILAFDKDSARRFDDNGHLHVSSSNISIADVNPYLGKEIPRHKELGLDPNRIYQMFRHPDELKKAAKTFDGKPLLDMHVAVSAWDHPKQKVVGSIGTDAEFDGKFLKNSLVVWDAKAIEKIEDGEQKEISCSYSYDADMTSGTYNGKAYDGVMRNIKANHVALVAAGRAGSDVVVSDSINQIIEDKMKKSYRKSTLAKLATDAKVDKVEDLLAILANDEAETEEEAKKEALEAKKEKEAEDEEETEEEKEERLKKEKKAEDDEKEEDEKKEKAMDAVLVSKIKAETKAEMRATHEAQEVVRPWVGKLAAMDSAEEVYKAALDLKGIDIQGVPSSAYRHIVLAHMKAETKPIYTHDAKITESIPADMKRIKRA